MRHIRSFRNSPFVIKRVPNVFNPSRAWAASCAAVSLSTGPPGLWTSPALICRASQMNSCNKLPSFLVRNSNFARSMTSCRSWTRTRPSSDNSLDGDVRYLDEIELFNATSHCLFCRIVSSPSASAQVPLKGGGELLMVACRF